MQKCLTAAARIVRTAAGWVGYGGIIAEYLFLVLLYIQAFIEVPVVKTVLIPRPTEPVAPPTTPVAPSAPLPGWIVPPVVAALLLGIAYGIYRLLTRDMPAAKQKADMVTQQVAREAVRHIERHHPIARRQEVRLTVRLAYWFKLAVTLLPLIIVLIFRGVTMPIHAAVAISLMALLAMLTVLLWTIERALARR